MSKKSNIIIKNQVQIECIRQASKLAAQTLEYIAAYIRPGISTIDLDRICDTFIVSHGGKSACKGYRGYPRYTCISLNDTICHGIPTEQEILKEGDILNVDVTVIKNGYFWDTSTMFTVGSISEEAKKLIDVTKRCLDVGIKEVRPDNQFGNIGFVIASLAESHWYSVVREYTGHGIGASFHEDPYVYHKANQNTGEFIKPGMIFTIEPMINIGTYKTTLLDDGWTVKTKDGSLSAQFEHTILVTETGYEILTVA